jgi:adenylyl-sulfate kinase
MSDLVSSAEYEALSGHRGAVVWFTGLSGAGKSTLSLRVERRLHEAGVHTRRLDGDVVRDGLNADLGFSPEDRTENVRRIACVAELFADTGVIALVAVIAPYESDRAAARAMCPPGRYFEIYVDTSLEVCERRDVKGLYAKARAGKLREFTGIDAPYEIPESPELVANGAGDLEVEAARVIALLREHGIIA